jgi:hypothetical protein
MIKLRDEEIPDIESQLKDANATMSTLRQESEEVGLNLLKWPSR